MLNFRTKGWQELGLAKSVLFSSSPGLRVEVEGSGLGFIGFI